MTLNLAADAPLLQAFATLPDPRKSRNQIYPLMESPLSTFYAGLIIGLPSLNGLMRMNRGFSLSVFVLMAFPLMTP